MSKKPGSRKKSTVSPRLRNTKKSSASTPTSRHSLHRSVATELYAASLVPPESSRLNEAVVEGVSMWPILRAGYRVAFRRINPESLSPGDIIVIQVPGREARVHRLVGRVGPLFLEAGDNTFTATLVSPENILGRVESVRDWKGKKIALPAWKAEDRRTKYFLFFAHSFMFAHEVKDRLVGRKKSRLLWQASRLYRFGLTVAGLEVPALFPKK